MCQVVLVAIWSSNNIRQPLNIGKSSRLQLPPLLVIIIPSFLELTFSLSLAWEVDRYDCNRIYEIPGISHVYHSLHQEHETMRDIKKVLRRSNQVRSCLVLFQNFFLIFMMWHLIDTEVKNWETQSLSSHNMMKRLFWCMPLCSLHNERIDWPWAGYHHL